MRSGKAGVRGHFAAQHYRTVAMIIRSLPEIPPVETSGVGTQKAVADHFANEFFKRSASFDAAAWNDLTGGSVDRALVEYAGQDRNRRKAKKLPAGSKPPAVRGASKAVAAADEIPGVKSRSGKVR